MMLYNDVIFFVCSAQATHRLHCQRKYNIYQTTIQVENEDQIPSFLALIVCCNIGLFDERFRGFTLQPQHRCISPSRAAFCVYFR